MSVKAVAPVVGKQETLPIALLALAVAGVMQFAGALNINVGIGSIVIFPMVWGLIAGLLISVQKFKPLGIDLQKAASALVSVTVLVLVARLAFNIGPNLMLLVNAGPALLLQEIGHLLGTVALALPLAVLLRMGTSTIGATFSLDREPSFAIVSEKYGPDSHQYRGVLSMYVFGTLFGAVFITLLTSLVTNWGIFDPLALAMGAGVGSGSMMAASAGVIADAYPAQADEIFAIASVSNLITTLLGVYVGIWLALPLADKFYHFLTRGKHKQEIADAEAQAERARTAAAAGTLDAAEAEQNRTLVTAIESATSTVSVPLRLSIPIITVLGLVTAMIAAKGFSWQVLAGYGVLIGLTLLGIWLGKVTRVLPSVIWITTLGAYLSSPWFFGGEWMAAQVGTIDVLSIATVMLTLAGLSLGKDVPMLKSIGWKIIPVGLVAITASFLLSTIIAEFSLGFWG